MFRSLCARCLAVCEGSAPASERPQRTGPSDTLAAVAGFAPPPRAAARSIRAPASPVLSACRSRRLSVSVSRPHCLCAWAVHSSLTCIGTDCGRVLGHSEVVKALDGPSKARFKALLNEDCVTASANLKWCPVRNPSLLPRVTLPLRSQLVAHHACSTASGRRLCSSGGCPLNPGSTVGRSCVPCRPSPPTRCRCAAAASQTAECGTVIKAEAGSSIKGSVECRTCRSSFCFECGVEHQPAACEHMKQYSLMYVVLANKQDRPPSVLLLGHACSGSRWSIGQGLLRCE